MGSIKDKTAIIGVGCTKFGELWEKDAEDLIVDAAFEAMDDSRTAHAFSPFPRREPGAG